MAVITISRETGSGGHSIAEQAARALQYKLIDKDHIGRIFTQYGANGKNTPIGYLPDFWTRFEPPIDEQRASLVAILNRIILALAHQDNMVIVGRSGFAVLAEFEDVLNVRIQAPLPVRIRRVMERRNIGDPASAKALVRESDRVRTAFIEGFYGSSWNSAKAFDLVIDTGKISEQCAVNWIIQAAHGLQEQLPREGHLLSAILVEPSLASIISRELHDKVVHR